MRRLVHAAATTAILCFAAKFAFGGGPLVIGSPAVGNRPAFGVDAQPFTWNPAKMPIAYRVDPGPMAVNPSSGTVIDHATGLQRLQSMFAVWQDVSTASISYSNIGALLPAGSYSGGDLKTARATITAAKALGILKKILVDGKETLRRR